MHLPVKPDNFKKISITLVVPLMFLFLGADERRHHNGASSLLVDGGRGVCVCVCLVVVWGVSLNVCQRKERTLSQQKVGESPRVEKSWREGGAVGKGKAPGVSGGEPGIVDEDVSDSQPSVAAGTHRSRPTGHIVTVSQPRVSQTESSKNYFPTPVPLERRGPGDGGILQLSERVVIIQTVPGDPNLSRG